jgi:hypothetical protein
MLGAKPAFPPPLAIASRASAYLLPAVLTLIGAGCAPISSIQPSFASSARISLATMHDGCPAVSLAALRAIGGPSLPIPGNGFYLRPGEYSAHLACDRKFSEDGVTIEAPGTEGPDNFSFSVVAGKQYALDCKLNDEGPQFMLVNVTGAQSGGARQP